MAERLGSPDAAGYAAAALVKLDRPERALEAFEAPGAPPAGRDALLDHYHALACYDARLYLRADALLARVGARSGPKIAEQAARIRADIAALLAKPPPRAAIDWYLERCDANRAAGRAVLTRAYCEEARALAERAGDAQATALARARLQEVQPTRAEAR